jgi:hypothetical protein
MSLTNFEKIFAKVDSISEGHSSVELEEHLFSELSEILR